MIQVDSVSIESSEKTEVTHYRLIGNKTLLKEARKRKLNGWISCALWGSSPDDLYYPCIVIQLPMMSVRTPGDIGLSVHPQDRWSMADALSVYLTVIGYIRLFQEQLLLMTTPMAMRYRVLPKAVWMIIMSFYSHLFLFEAMENDYGYERRLSLDEALTVQKQLDRETKDRLNGAMNALNRPKPHKKPTVTFSNVPAPSSYVPPHRMNSPFAEYRYICGSVIPWNRGIHRVPLRCLKARNDVVGVVCNVDNGSVSPLHWSAAHWSTATIYGLTRDGMMISNNIILEEDLWGWEAMDEVSVTIDCDYGRISFFIGKERVGKAHDVMHGKKATYFLMVGSQSNDSLYQAEVF